MCLKLNCTASKTDKQAWEGAKRKEKKNNNNQIKISHFNILFIVNILRIY